MSEGCTRPQLRLWRFYEGILSATSFETSTASGTCRERPRITGGTGGQVSGSGEGVDEDVFRHSRELSSCD